MKQKQKTEPGLTLADVESLTAAATADLFAAKMQVMRRAFVENGKLIYHLDSIKLRAGQTVYGLLKSRGVSEGSIHSARTVANLIAGLVVAGHVTEARFDEVVTFRTARLGDLLLKGKGRITLKPEQLAAILQNGDSSAVGSELECLHEHGLTIAERETKLAEADAATEALKAQAAEAEKLKAAEATRLAKEQAEAAKAAAQANANPPDPDEDEDDADAETDEDEDTDTDADEDEDADAETDEDDADDEADVEADEETDEADDDEAADIEDDEPEEITSEATVPTGTKPAKPTPPPAPPTATLESIVDRVNSALIDAMDLDGQDMAKLVGFLRQATNELAATLESLEVAA